MSALGVVSPTVRFANRLARSGLGKLAVALPAFAVVVLLLSSAAGATTPHPSEVVSAPGHSAARAAGTSAASGAEQLRWAQASLAAGFGPHPDPAAAGDRPVTPSGSAPSLGLCVSLAYDAADGYVLGVALNSTNTSGSYTWGAIVQTWTFHSGNWTQLPITAAPPNRAFESLTYDPTDGYVLLFGGNGYGSEPAYLGDTWTYLNGTWTNLTSSLTTAPSARGSAPMTWDAADGYALMLDGFGSSGNLTSTWSYVGGAWTQRTPDASVPHEGALAYDVADGYVVYFGGADSSGALSADTWKYLNGSWTRITPSVTGAPSARAGPAMAYDPNFGALLLFGGVGTYNPATGTVPYLNDTWTYRNLTWTLLSSASGPPPRAQAQLVFDAADNESVLFGGADFSTGAEFSDTWTFTPAVNTTNRSSSWTQAAPLLRVSAAVDDKGAAVEIRAIGVQGSQARYSYTGLPPGCASADASVLECVPNATGNFTVDVATTSSSGTASAETYLEVVAGPAIGSFRVSPAVVEANATVTFTATTSGGVSPVAVSYSGLPENCSSVNALTLACTPTVAGTYVVTARLTDALGVNSTAQTSLDVVARLTLAGLATSPATLDVGQSSSVTAEIRGGLAPYTYLFASLPNGCIGVNAPSFSCTPAGAGVFPVEVQVTDWLGYAASGATTLTVNPDPTIVSFAPSLGSLNVGTSVTFTTVASGGTGTLNYSYAGLPTGCAATDQATVTCAPTAAGNYTISVVVVDAVGYSASSTATITVNAAPIVVPPNPSPNSPGKNSGSAQNHSGAAANFWSTFLPGLAVGLLALAVSVAALIWRARVVRQGVELVRQMKSHGPMAPPPASGAHDRASEPDRIDE